MSMSEHGANSAEPRLPDLAVQWRTFLGIGLFIAVIAVVYWFASYDYAGAVMLSLAAVLSFTSAGYLWTQDRNAREAAAEGEAEAEEHFLPHASVWPFGIGLGAFLAFNGLILGLGFAVPGAIVIGVSVAGFVAQTRRRD
jgi:drug/metabolite transporter (DMT)-like permease